MLTTFTTSIVGGIVIVINISISISISISINLSIDIAVIMMSCEKPLMRYFQLLHKFTTTLLIMIVITISITFTLNTTPTSTIMSKMPIMIIITVLQLFYRPLIDFLITSNPPRLMFRDWTAKYTDHNPAQSCIIRYQCKVPVIKLNIEMVAKLMQSSPM